MKMTYSLLSVLLLTSACFGSKYPYQPQFVAPSELSERVLAAPPARGSDEFNQEINTIIARQHNLTDQDKATIRVENKIEPEMIVIPVLGKNYTRENYPALYELLAHAASDAWRIADVNQEYWKSPRPWMADKRVQLLAPIITTYGYPSGHTTTNRVWAHVLSDVFPSKEHAFFARAEAIAQHRMDGGVHFPHDLEGGRQLSAAIYSKMSQDPEFQDELVEAKHEVYGSDYVKKHKSHTKAKPAAHKADDSVNKTAASKEKANTSKDTKEEPATPRRAWWQRL